MNEHTAAAAASRETARRALGQLKGLAARSLGLRATPDIPAGATAAPTITVAEEEKLMSVVRRAQTRAGLSAAMAQVLARSRRPGQG